MVAFQCQPQSLLVLDFGTWLGLGQGGFGTKGLGTGLNNYFFKARVVILGLSKIAARKFSG